MTRFEYMIRNGKEGVRLGIIQVDLAIKYEAYITYLEFFDYLQKDNLSNRKRRALAIQMASDKLDVSPSTIWRYLAFFDYVTPTKEEITLYKNQTRWDIRK